jgi:RNA polymerase-interacting CarD/CdnL/TRCF family regulator
MKVQVYFLKEPEGEMIIKNNRISNQALFTLYDLVWESEFKNILNPGRIWLKFKEEDKPFGMSLREKKSHNKINLGDIIQIAEDYYIVDTVGVRKITIIKN